MTSKLQSEWPDAGGTPRCSITRKTRPLRIARAPSGQRSMSSPPTCSSNTSRRLPRTQEVRKAGGASRSDRDVQRNKDTPMKRRLGDTGTRRESQCPSILPDVLGGDRPFGAFTHRTSDVTRRFRTVLRWDQRRARHIHSSAYAAAHGTRWWPLDSGRHPAGPRQGGPAFLTSHPTWSGSVPGLVTGSRTQAVSHSCQVRSELTGSAADRALSWRRSHRSPPGVHQASQIEPLRPLQFGGQYRRKGAAENLPLPRRTNCR